MSTKKTALPAGIPANPQVVHKQEWKGWADILGLSADANPFTGSTLDADNLEYIRALQAGEYPKMSKDAVAKEVSMLLEAAEAIAHTETELPRLCTPQQLFDALESCSTDRAVPTSLDTLNSVKVNKVVKEAEMLLAYLAERLRRAEGQTELWQRAITVNTNLAVLDQKTRGF